MNEKVISLTDYKKVTKLQKIKSKCKMFFLVIAGAIIISLVIWHFFVENIARYDVDIPKSDNINYQNSELIAIDNYKLAQLMHGNMKQLTIIYFYTTWCKGCIKNFKNINEIAREFQNSDLNLVVVAIDKEMNIKNLENYFTKYDKIYFKKYYLNDRDNFGQLLQENNINYQSKLPFIGFYDSNNELIEDFSGIKKYNFIRKKIINLLFLNN
ncbi:MAG: hypothetical protein CMP18_01555 [Rickettsiales bacterium]|jgi:thiol-disulfide isomerase/thioredoxin|nr:hypothetical protein [Rickettsiales bacterium]|tara:strand:+ start:10268 stop:10903 length:636 start_codon:yes stop_codon:yes gene_type:complete